MEVFPQRKSALGTKSMAKPDSALTDSSISVESSEFLWSSAGDAETSDIIWKPLSVFLRSRNVSRVLDLGCGNGALTAKIASLGYSVVGIDSSTTGISIARNAFPSIPFICGDLSQGVSPELANSFDVVISVEVIEHMLLPRQLSRFAYAALREDGEIFFTTPYHGYWKNLMLSLFGKWDSHWHPLRDFGHVKFFSIATFVQLLTESKFSRIKVRRVGRLPWIAKSMIATASRS